jgi:hypothetical protein
MFSTNKINNPLKYEDIIDINSLGKTNKLKLNSTQDIQTTITKYWTLNDYNITTSYVSGDSIYLHIISNINWKNYEGYIRESSIDSNVSLDIFHTIMTKSFNSEPNYSIIWKLEQNTLELNFNTLFDGFLPFSQSVKLGEKIMSGDASLTIKITEIESRYQLKIKKLEEQIESMQNEEIIFGYNPGTFGDYYKLRPNITVLDLTPIDSYEIFGNYMDFNKFKTLNKIIMYDRYIYCRTVKDFSYDGLRTHNSSNSYSDLRLNFLNNLFDSPQILLPSVVSIEIIFKFGYATNNFRSLPNLKKISFMNYANNQTKTFELIKNIPNLKHIEYTNCLNIENLDQIKNWTDTKGIKLEIK